MSAAAEASPVRVPVDDLTPTPRGDTGGPLLVAAAGSVTVVTDALQTQRERLDRLRAGLAADVDALLRIDTLAAVGGAGAPPAARRSEVELDEARLATRTAADLAEAAHVALSTAISSYEGAEQSAAADAQTAAAMAGAVLGALARMAWPGLAVAGAAGWALLSDPARQRQLADYMLAHPELITDPAFVEQVRWAVMSTDDAAGGALGLPPGAMEALLAGAGFVGVQGGAALVIGAAQPFGLMRESAVVVQQTSSSAISSAPAGVGERLARVPEVDQVRIERYDAPGQPPRYVVYVGPTETFSPAPTAEPWDLSSNVGGVAGLESGSVRATEQAMRAAGITSGDEVAFVGFSQGGLVAARMAASPEWNSVGLETHGAPTGNISLPEGLVGMAVRNTDDFVPALAGPQLDDHLLQVERQAFAPGSDIPTDRPAPAHQRTAYEATAVAVDGAQSEAVREQVAAMDAFTRDYASSPGGSITAMTYHAERVPFGAKRLGAE